MITIKLVFSNYTLDLDVSSSDTFKIILANINKYREVPISKVSCKINGVDQLVDLDVKLKDISDNIFYLK